MPSDFDARSQLPPSPVTGLEAAQRSALAALKQSAPDLQVAVDATSGHVSLLSSRRGLEGPAAGAGDGADAISSLLAAHGVLFGLEVEEMVELAVLEAFGDPARGVERVILGQRFHGLDVYGGSIEFGLEDGGKVVEIANHLVPHVSEASRPRASRLSLEQAAKAAARHLRVAVGVEIVPGRGDFEGELVWLPVRRDAMRLAWRLRLDDVAGERYELTVDAADGEVWTRYCLPRGVESLSPLPLEDIVSIGFGAGVRPAVGSNDPADWMSHDLVENAPPSVSIQAPIHGSKHLDAEEITFDAMAFDGLDGDVGRSLTWTSSLDGLIGFGASVTARLSLGEHVITATARDSRGESGLDLVRLSVTPPPPPAISVTWPEGDASIELETPFHVAAEAVNHRQEDLSPVIEWTSSLDGFLGWGHELYGLELSEGVHVITASVSDAGRESTAEVEVTVGPFGDSGEQAAPCPFTLDEAGRKLIVMRESARCLALELDSVEVGQRVEMELLVDQVGERHGFDLVVDGESLKTINVFGRRGEAESPESEAVEESTSAPSNDVWRAVTLPLGDLYPGRRVGVVLVHEADEAPSELRFRGLRLVRDDVATASRASAGRASAGRASD